DEFPSRQRHLRVSLGMRDDVLQALEETCWNVEVKKPPVDSRSNHRAGARSPAAKHGRAGGPGLDDRQPEGFRERWEHHHARALEQADEPGIVGWESPDKQHLILQPKAA